MKILGNKKSDKNRVVSIFIGYYTEMTDFYSNSTLPKKSGRWKSGFGRLMGKNERK